MDREISLMELSQVKGVGKSIMNSVLDLLNKEDYIENSDKYKIETLYNSIIKDDAFKILPKLPNHSVDLIITDTPYLHNKGGNGGGNTKIANSKMYKKDSKVMGEMSNFGYRQLDLLLKHSKRILKKMNYYAFCNDSLLAYYLYWATINGYKFNVLVWEKPLSVLNRERYSTNVEYIVRIYEDGVSLNKLDTSIKENSYKYSKVKNYKVTDKDHVTKKPNEYARDIIELSTKQNDVVLDCFAGEGTFLIEAKKLNRRYIGVEWDSKYYDLAVNKLNNVP